MIGWIVILVLVVLFVRWAHKNVWGAAPKPSSRTKPRDDDWFPPVDWQNDPS